MSSKPLVIVGTGLAGYNLAREWRKLDSSTPLLLISADDGRSYSKPMLSTGFAKNKQADELVMADVGAMAEQLNAEIRTHTPVTRIEPEAKRLWLGAEAIDYRDLVLALGADPIALDIPGDAADHVYAINDLEDYARFRAAIDGKQRVLLMGAGLIGCEFANDLTSGGLQVSVVAPCDQVMPGLIQPQAAEAVQHALQALGVAFHLGPVVSRLSRDGEALRAELSDGTVLACDAVVSAVGLRPRTQLASAAGLTLGRGIAVDRQLQSSAAHVYALGDCAEVAGLNLQYVMPLMACARALAKTLAGEPTAVSYGAMPVVVKTPACPLVVAPPPAGSNGQWRVEGQAPDLRLLCHDADGALLGFNLTGSCVSERMALNKSLPPALA